MNTYSGGGGALQMFVPYSPSYGGTGLQVRFGNYDVSSGNSWTSWKTLLANDNYTGYSTFTGIVSSGTGTGGGFQNTTFAAGRNRVWSFGNADAYGLSYFQGGPDYIGLHFGTATQAASQFWVSDSGISQTSGSSRAPIFYDSNDTGYYLDPNSTSQSALRIRGGALHGPNSTWGAYLLVGGDGRQSYIDNTSTASICTTNGNLHIDAASGYITYINHYDGTGIYFGNGASATVAEMASDGTFRSPIFYDYNDTTYRINGNGESILYRLRVGPYAGSTSSGNVTGLEIMNAGGTGDGSVAAISFHCQGQYGAHMHLRADSYFGVGGWSASTWRWYVQLSTGNMTAAGFVSANSDPRLKENLEPITSAVEKLNQIQGYKFKWKNMSPVGNPGKYDYGVLATDVEKVAPEIVQESAFESEDGDKYKTVAYSNLIPFLIEAIKEQQNDINNLKQQIKNLKTS